MFKWLGLILVVGILSAPLGLAKETGAKAKSEGLVISIPPPPLRTVKGVINPPLQATRFSVGADVELDQPFDPHLKSTEGCIDKPGIGAMFCIDPIDWPAPLMAALELADDDTIYRGGRAVVRYDGGQVSQAHVMFPASAFIDVIEFLTVRYGPPTEQDVTVRPVPGAPEITNTIVRWKSVFAGGQAPMFLEVRAVDDVRHVHPDRLHGFMWLYRDGATPVFRHFSTVDLMRLNLRRLGQWPIEEDDGD